MRRGPALLGGVAFGFATYLVIWLHPHGNAYVVLPWLLLVADRLCQRGTVRDAALLALLLGISFLGAATAAERRRMLLAATVVALLPAAIVVGAHLQWLGDLVEGAKRVFGAGAEKADTIALASVLRWLAFAVAAIALFALLGRWRHRSALLIAAVIGLAALDLLTISSGYNPAIAKEQADPPEPPAVAAMRRLTAEGGRVVGPQAMQPNTASRWGLLDTFYPGWKAEVDGDAQPIRAADLAFRAVAVAPGRHTVRFSYRPTSVIAGGAISVAALLVIVLGLIPFGRGARRRRASASSST